MPERAVSFAHILASKPHSADVEQLIRSYIGRGGRFGRDASLYRYRSQLYGRLWVRLSLPTWQISEI